MTDSARFERKNIRLPAVRYRGRAFYFLTLCFNNRRRFGVNPRVAAWLITQLRKHATACNFHIHAYCVMPDHMHILAASASDESNMLKLVESFKQETAIEFMRKTHRRLWQFKFYDRILRAADSADPRRLVHLAKSGASGSVPHSSRLPIFRFLYRARHRTAQESLHAGLDSTVEEGLNVAPRLQRGIFCLEI